MSPDPAPQRAVDRSSPHARWRAGALRLAGGLLLALLWEAAGRASKSLLLPSFTETVVALAQLASGAQLWEALWTSNEALATGFAAALVIGLPLGMVLGWWPRLAGWIDPYLHLLLVVPTTALIPLIFIVTGPGLVTRALVVWVFAIPIVVQCARTAVHQVDPRLLDLARSFGATRAQLWTRVVLPAAVPGVMTGVRLGLARAVEGMVVVELLLVAVGVGGLLLDFQGRFESAHVYAIILVVMAEASVLSHAGRRLERRLTTPASGGRP